MSLQDSEALSIFGRFVDTVKYKVPQTFPLAVFRSGFMLAFDTGLSTVALFSLFLGKLQQLLCEYQTQANEFRKKAQKFTEAWVESEHHDSLADYVLSSEGVVYWNEILDFISDFAEQKELQILELEAQSYEPGKEPPLLKYKETVKNVKQALVSMHFPNEADRDTWLQPACLMFRYLYYFVEYVVKNTQ